MNQLDTQISLGAGDSVAPEKARQVCRRRIGRVELGKGGEDERESHVGFPIGDRG